MNFTVSQVKSSTQGYNHCVRLHRKNPKFNHSFTCYTLHCFSHDTGIDEKDIKSFCKQFNGRIINQQAFFNSQCNAQYFADLMNSRVLMDKLCK